MKSKVLRRSIAAEVPSGIWFQVHCKSICLALWLLIFSSFSVRMSSLQYKKIQITQPSSLRNESGLIYRTSGNPALGWPHSRLWAGELRTSAAKKLAVGLGSPDRWYIMVFLSDGLFDKKKLGTLCRTCNYAFMLKTIQDLLCRFYRWNGGSLVDSEHVWVWLWLVDSRTLRQSSKRKRWTRTEVTSSGMKFINVAGKWLVSRHCRNWNLLIY